MVTSDLIKDVVAFANSCGGTIYIGLNDQGEVVGQHACLDVIKRATSSIQDTIKPDISEHVTLHVKKVEYTDIFFIQASRGDCRSYYIDQKVLKLSGVYKAGKLIISCSRRLYKTNDKGNL